jgi:hypothetical protein
MYTICREDTITNLYEKQVFRKVVHFFKKQVFWKSCTFLGKYREAKIINVQAGYHKQHI